MSLKILKASAGSGKTFQLTRHYLQLCLQNPNPLFFQHILAITFTNKATQEMKEKILEACRILAREPDKSDHLKYFKETLNLSAQEISDRAGRILEEIIYHYGRFSISTIDRFFQRVLRAFAREIKIDDAFEIRLDTTKILTAALDEMIDRLDEEHDATAGIRSMIDTRIEDQKSWKFDEDLVKFGQELFKEGLIADQTLDVQQLLEIKGELRKYVQHVDNELQTYRKGVQQIIERSEIAPNEFKGKGNSFIISFVKDRSLTDFAILKLVKANAENQASDWLTGFDKHPKKGVVLSIFKDLQFFFIKAYSVVERDEFKYNTAKAVLRNFDSFILLAAIQKAVKDYTKAENIFVLANTQPLLKDVITSEKAPFLYEKIGSLYKYYLIDEFQDTSKLQYENLIPLLEEAMSHQESGDSLVVGDTKQAIYRWRGGDWALLEENVASDFPYSSQDHLAYNFRSFNTIIEFNNSFYKQAAQHIERVMDAEIEVEPDSPIHHRKSVVSRIFQGAEQALGNTEKQGGYVEIVRVNKFKGEQFNKEEMHKACLELLQEKIIDLSSNGFNGRELCILYRNNKEGDEIAEFLSALQLGPQKDLFQFQSDDSLYLKNSYSVLATIQFLTLLVSPEHQIARLNLWQILHLQELVGPPNYELISDESFFDNFYPELQPLFGMDETSDVIQMAQLFWEKTGLNTNEQDRAYLSALQDVMIDYARSHGNDVAGFIEYYYDVSDDLKIKGDPTAQGIQLMSIHQSKGLEFEVVLIPFAYWDLQMRGNIWVKGELSPIPIDSPIPIVISSKLKRSNFRDDYFEESIRNYVDQINLLYVATTRAVQQLFMFVSEVGKKKDLSSATISDFILNSIEMEDATGDEEERFSYYRKGNPVKVETGLKSEPEKPEMISLNFNIRQHLPSIKEGIHPEALELEAAIGNDRSPVSIGYIVHMIFENMKDVSEADQAILKLVQDGIIQEEERAFFESMITQILMDQQIQPWFNGDNELIIEKDILMPNGHVYRPDRVVCMNDETWILDFKSGGRSDYHHRQVYNYVRILEKMEYPSVKGFIYYTTEKTLVGV